MPEGGIGGLLSPGTGESTAETAIPVEETEPGAPLSVLSEEATTPVAPPPAETSEPGALLGVEQASLGSPADPGLWLSTRHVTQATQGRVRLATTGQSVDVELRPSGGAGGRMSITAMQMLGLPLTALAEVEVYAGG